MAICKRFLKLISYRGLQRAHFVIRFDNQNHYVSSALTINWRANRVITIRDYGNIIAVGYRTCQSRVKPGAAELWNESSLPSSYPFLKSFCLIGCTVQVKCPLFKILIGINNYCIIDDF